MNVLALDTETTGLSFYKGDRPFLVVGCDGSNNYYWKGQVIPYTREVFWDDSDLEEIQQFIDSHDKVVFHNAQFDVRALSSIEISIPWDKVEDTQVAAHLIASGDKLDLEYLGIKYYSYWNDHERELQKTITSKRLSSPDYKTASKKTHPHLKSSKWWKMDMWLDMDNCLKYALTDVETTYLLWKAFYIALWEDGTYDLYKLRRSLLKICYDITEAGLQLDVEEMKYEILRLEETVTEIRKEIEKALGMRSKFQFDRKAHLVSLLEECGDIRIFLRTETGAVSTAEASMRYYYETSKHPLLKKLMEARKLRTKISFLKSYLLRADKDGRLHSTINITGTRETRQSSSDPNQQNISKEVRHLFGPPPGKFWMEADFANIELRIWAYATKNKQLIEAFEKGESVHLLIMKAIYPQEYKRHIKEPTIETKKLYTKVKSGNFALIYGATEEKADATYGKTGATELVYKNFPGIKEFMESKRKECIKNFDKLGRFCVFTLGGYPLDVPPEDPYKATNFYVQGTAGFFMSKAMVSVSQRPRYIDSGAKMCAQVHDSLTIEIPFHPGHHKTIASIKEAMENCVVHSFGKTPIDYDIKLRKGDYKEEDWEGYDKVESGNFYVLSKQ
ncbi:MAG: hypothetical protein KatS3mg087_1394 [Patescibacteria group bacterium]|nr:MAG: hypothetical protein KatS3mg087_1394 [Patescibacteria group bacterium]